VLCGLPLAISCAGLTEVERSGFVGAVSLASPTVGIIVTSMSLSLGPSPEPGEGSSLSAVGMTLPHAGPQSCPPPRNVARAAAVRALQALGELGRTSGLTEPPPWDGELNERLATLIFEGPFPVIGRCAHRMVYAALDPLPWRHGQVILTAPFIAPENELRGGAGDLRDVERTNVVLAGPMAVHDGAHEPGSEWPGGGSWGEPWSRRRVLTCRSCDKRERVTEAHLVALFLGAVVDGETEMNLDIVSCTVGSRRGDERLFLV